MLVTRSRVWPSALIRSMKFMCPSSDRKAIRPESTKRGLITLPRDQARRRPAVERRRPDLTLSAVAGCREHDLLLVA